MTTYTTMSSTQGVVPPCDYLHELNNLVEQLNTNAGNITNNGSTVTLGGTTAANASVAVPTVLNSVDYVVISGSATGAPGTVSIKADGTDPNVGLIVTSKGTSDISLGGTTHDTASLHVTNVATAGNHLTITGSTTGSSLVTCAAKGNDTDITLLLSCKGAGGVAMCGSTVANSSLNVAPVTNSVDFIQISGDVTGTFSPKIVATGTDSNVNLLLQTKGTGVVAAGGTTAANASLQVATVSSSVDFVKISGDATGTFSPAILATGTDTNVNLLLQTKGSGVVAAGGTTAANASLQVATVASSVDFVQISGDATATHAPKIVATGTDAAVSLLLQSKGTGVVAAGGTTEANCSLKVATVASAVDFLTISGDVTATHAPSIVAGGTDSNISIVLTPKGTGLIQFGTAGCFSANASVATVLGSVGPSGSRTTVQKWLTVNDNSGNPFYIPCF